MTEAISQAVNAATDAVKSAIYTKPKEPEDWLSWEQVEQPVEDEDRKIEEVCKVIRRVVDRNAEEHSHGLRATHVKGLGYVKGELKVNADLPQHLQHGLFAIPGKSYTTIVRFANEPSHLKADTENMPRGLSMKIFGVDGERIDSAAYGDTGTQDIMMNNAPMLELTNLDTTLEIFTLREKYWRDPAALKAELAKRSDRTLQFAPGTLPSKPILGMDMFSQSAFRYGPYACHFSLVPDTPAQKEFANAPSYSSSEDYMVLRDHIRSHLAKQPVAYKLRAQFVSDLAKQPVEDGSTAWDEFLSPWHDLAVLTIPPQESYSDARRTWWDNKIALSPFNGLIAHRPLGSVNRLRKKVYEASRKYRAQKNTGVIEEARFLGNADEMPE